MDYSKRSGNNFSRTKVSLAGIKKVLLVFFFQIFTLFGYSTVYYVSSSSGNDGNSGTSVSSAWRSLSKVNSFTPKPGDQILFKRGDEWAGTIAVKASGTSGSPIIYGAYGSGEKPKIYGSEVITGWTLHSGNIYKTKVNKEIIQLFINGEQATLARYPKKGYLSISSVKSSTSFVSDDLESKPADYYNGSVLIVKSRLYTLSQKKVTDSDGKYLAIDTAPSGSLNVGEGFFLYNKLDFLTQPGEWHFDSSTQTVYLWMPNGDSPGNYEIRGSVYESGIAISNGKDFITIKELELGHQGKYGVYMYDSDDITVENTTITQCQGVAIHSRYVGNRLQFKNNFISDAFLKGIHINYGDNYTIEGNTIERIGLMSGLCRQSDLFFTPGTAITVLHGNADIRYNRIINCGDKAIFFNSGTTNIYRNYINGALLELNDGAAIYSVSGNYAVPGIANSKISENIILNVHGGVEGAPYSYRLAYGVYLDGLIHDVSVENNLIAHTSGGININQGGRNKIRANTFFDCLVDINSAGQREPSTVENNIMFKTERKGVLPILRNTHQRFVYELGDADNNFNFNFYIVPYNETNVFVGYDDFGEWQAAGKDINGNYDGKDMPSGEEEQLFYNSSEIEKVFSINNAKAKDIYGNLVTESFTLKPFTSKILIGANLSEITDASPNSTDLTPPNITSFSLLSSSTSLSVPVTSLSADDNIAVTGYKLSESAVAPNSDDSGWSDAPPTWYTFSSEGVKTLYAWAKDAAGNISESKSAQVTITAESGSGELGNTEVYGLTSTMGNRRAQPISFSESGEIQSISIFHNGGTGNVLLGIYSDNSGSPQSLLGVTPATAINSTEGWQTVSLTTPLNVPSGETVWLAWVFENNPGVRYTSGAPGRAHSSETWTAGIPNLFGNSSIGNYKYSIFCNYTTGQSSVTSTLGNSKVFDLTTTLANRRAQPVTFSESGEIQSISIYHHGGTGNVLLGVYSDNSGSPQSLLGVTTATAINSTEGWQTVSLSTPVNVPSGETVWLAWVFENNPGIRYTSGTPGRAHSSETWTAGIPNLFGNSSVDNYRYSIFCSYITGQSSVTSTLGNSEVFDLTTTLANRRAQPVTFSESGEIQSISIYHHGGIGNVLLGIYSDNSGSPQSLLGVTPATAINSTEGWQTISLLEPVNVNSGETVWLAWVFENNPGIRYTSGTSGTSGRAHSSETWAAGMPASFGSSSVANYRYSIYCNFIPTATSLKGAEIPEIPYNETLLETEDKNPMHEVDANKFIFYPNPAKSFITIDFSHLPETKTEIKIIDSNGRIIIDKLIQSYSTRIDINHLLPGLYFIKSVNREMDITQKLIIQR